MEIEEAIYTRLAAYTGLTDLVGTRITSGEKSQDVVLPAVNYKSITKLDEPCMGSTPSLRKNIMQFDVWAATQQSAVLVSRQVENAFNRYHTTTGMTIYDTRRKNTIQLGMDGESRQYHIAIDIEFDYDEQ